LSALYAERWSEALDFAQQAIEFNDPIPAYPTLIAAAATAWLGEPEKARALREQALQSWPESLKTQERAGAVESGLLWIDTKAELDDLLARVDSALSSAKRP
jgi:hypothetical protein